jgi:hypothetical protein
MPLGVRRGVVVASLLVVAACSPAPPEPVVPAPPTARLRVGADLTQDSRDDAAGRIAVVVRNEGAHEITPEAIGYADPRLSVPLTAGRLRAIPPGAQRRFPLPLTDPVCDGSVAGAGRLAVVVGTDEVAVPARDEVGVVDRWVERRCAELDVAAVAPLAFTEVRPVRSGEAADLVLTATPTGEGDGAYVIESIAGTPVFTSVGEPWAPAAAVAATGDRVDVPLPARPARCDGHVFGESAGATAFLVGVLLDGERREVLVRMSPELAAMALGFALEACRAREAG